MNTSHDLTLRAALAEASDLRAKDSAETDKAIQRALRSGQTLTGIKARLGVSRERIVAVRDGVPFVWPKKGGAR